MGLRAGTGFGVRPSNCNANFWLVKSFLHFMSLLTVASSDQGTELRSTSSAARSVMGVVMARFAITAMGRSVYFVARMWNACF